MMFVAEKYEYTADITFKVYSFISYGPKGAIHKIARFSELYADIYNFGFGDYDIVSGGFSDTRISNNEDMPMIMGTPGSIIYRQLYTSWDKGLMLDTFCLLSFGKPIQELKERNDRAREQKGAKYHKYDKGIKRPSRRANCVKE